MNYLIICFFATTLMCSKTLTFGYPSKLANNYDIDDFITSLLSSQKFDELADKIADKAVLKLANVASMKGEHTIENNNKNSDEDSSEHSTPKSEKRLTKNSRFNEKSKKLASNKENNEKKDKKSAKESQKSRQNKIQLRIEQGSAGYKERAKKTPPSRESKEKQEETVTEETRNPKLSKQFEQDNGEYVEKAKRPVSNDENKVKPGKINTEALLKNDDESGQPKLLLKYEHFKKRVQQNQAHENPETASESRNKNYKTSNGQHEYDKSNEHREQVSKRASKLEGDLRRGRKDFSYSRDIEPNGQWEYHVRKPQFKQKKMKPVFQSTSNVERTTRQYYEYDENDNERQEDPVFRQNSNDSKNDEDVPVEKNTEVGYELGELTTRTRFIRQEGNKYYTYLSGPEYEEFHAQYEKPSFIDDDIKVN